MLMATGIIALAVPGSSAFAGEFLILAGIFSSGWGWAVAGATGIVLAAMYMLRLISAVLHREPGLAVSDAALDLRPAELGILIPLVACLLALSAWPAAISGNTLETSSGAAPLAELVPRNEYHALNPADIRRLARGIVSQLKAQRPPPHNADFIVPLHSFSSGWFRPGLPPVTLSVSVGASDRYTVRVSPEP
jgi:hypothetical protein